jgi:CO dehydrogenase nickel-insertion accessory protein CooC1
MAEVIGTISAVISVIEASIKAYDSAKKDAKLPEMFETVRRRLPIILNTLAICQNNLEPRKHSIPRNVCEALNATLVICRTRAKDLEKIFQKIVPGESDTGEQRCLKVLRRLGKGNKVEELMLGLAEEVQLVINHDAVKSANQAQNADLEGIRNEMKSFISRSDDEISTMNVNTGNGAQTNNVQRSSGNSYTVNGDGRQYFGQIQNFGKD